MNIFLFNIFLLALVAIQSVNPLPGQLDILTDGSGEDSPQQAVHSGSGGTSKNLELTSTPVSNKTNTGAVATDLDNPNYFEGDLNIPQEQISQAYKLQGTSNVRQKRGAISERRWPNGIVYFNYHSSVSSTLKRKIRTAISEFERETCLQFRSPTGRDYIQFRADDVGCYSSSVGKKGGKQKINLRRVSGCQTHGIIVHEIGHAIGLWHEQSRPDRDWFLNIHWENIMAGQNRQFEKRYNVDYQGESYDYQSVMHYGEYIFSKNGRKTISPKKSHGSINSHHVRLSQSDIRQINRMYRCPQASPGYTGILKVRMVLAKDLPDTDGWWNCPDPYACVEAVERSNNRHRLCTRRIGGTRYPRWNQELNFGTSSSGWLYFTITVWDQDSGRDDRLARTQTVYVRPGKHYESICTSLTRCVEFETTM